MAKFVTLERMSFPVDFRGMMGWNICVFVLLGIMAAWLAIPLGLDGKQTLLGYLAFHRVPYVLLTMLNVASYMWTFVYFGKMAFSLCVLAVVFDTTIFSLNHKYCYAPMWLVSFGGFGVSIVPCLLYLGYGLYYNPLIQPAGKWPKITDPLIAECAVVDSGKFAMHGIEHAMLNLPQKNILDFLRRKTAAAENAVKGNKVKPFVFEPDDDIEKQTEKTTLKASDVLEQWKQERKALDNKHSFFTFDSAPLVTVDENGFHRESGKKVKGKKNAGTLVSGTRAMIHDLMFPMGRRRSWKVVFFVLPVLVMIWVRYLFTVLVMQLFYAFPDQQVIISTLFSYPLFFMGVLLDIFAARGDAIGGFSVAMRPFGMYSTFIIYYVFYRFMLITVNSWGVFIAMQIISIAKDVLFFVIRLHPRYLEVQTTIFRLFFDYHPPTPQVHLTTVSMQMWMHTISQRLGLLNSVISVAVMRVQNVDVYNVGGGKTIHNYDRFLLFNLIAFITDSITSWALMRLVSRKHGGRPIFETGSSIMWSSGFFYLAIIYTMHLFSDIPFARNSLKFSDQSCTYRW